MVGVEHYDVEELEWVCEGALWGKWVTRGTLASTSATSRVECSAEKLKFVVTQHCSGQMWRALRNYAVMFVGAFDLDSVADVVDSKWAFKNREEIAGAAFATYRSEVSSSFSLSTWVAGLSNTGMPTRTSVTFRSPHASRGSLTSAPSAPLEGIS
uniref:Uncharacterized protein n=1 Tax=Zooxanthella nutricula TaxID=1333877 RepID=A0A7S2K0M1_9DINO